MGCNPLELAGVPTRAATDRPHTLCLLSYLLSNDRDIRRRYRSLSNSPRALLPSPLYLFLREKNNPAFDFLQPSNKFHPFYRAGLAAAKKGAPPTASSNGSGIPAGQGTQPRTVTQPDGARAPPPTAKIVSEQAAVIKVDHAVNLGVDHVSVATTSEGERSGDADAGDRQRTENDAEPEQGVAKSDDVSGGTGASGEVVRNGDLSGGVQNVLENTGDDEELSASRAHAVELRTKLAVALAQSRDDDDVSDCLDSEANGAGDASNNIDEDDEAGDDELGSEAASEDTAETRRANRLKRARLMKGHYQLAVMHSRGQDPAGDGILPVRDGKGADARASPEVDGMGDSPQQGSGGGVSQSSDDLSDLDSGSDLEKVDDEDFLGVAAGEKASTTGDDGKTADKVGEGNRKPSTPSKRRRSAEKSSDSRRSKDTTDRRDEKRRSRSRSRSRRHGSSSKTDSRNSKSRHHSRESRSRSRERRGGGERNRSGRDRRQASSRDRDNHDRRNSSAGDKESSRIGRSGGGDEDRKKSDGQRKADDTSKRERDRKTPGTRRSEKEQRVGSSSDKTSSTRRESDRRNSRERGSRGATGDSRGSRERGDNDTGSSSRRDSRGGGDEDTWNRSKKTRERDERGRKEERKDGDNGGSNKRSRRR